MLSQIREQFSKILMPIIIFFANLGIHPNVFTFVGLFLSIGAGVFLALNNVLVAFILIGFGSFMDMLDGGVARYNNLASRKGSLLDSIVDRVSDVAIFGGLIFSKWVDIFTGVIMVAACLMISYVRAKGESIGVEKMAVGIMERAERLIFLQVLLFLHLMIPAFYAPFFAIPALGFFDGSYFTIGYMILTGLSVITVIQRYFYAASMLDKEDKAEKEKVENEHPVIAK